MSGIAPNTIIKILKNIPLDNTYNHTLYFTSLTTQQNYFNSKIKYTFNDQSYQRYAKNKLRIAVLADNIYDCNYLMFQNATFGNKWFYAFITEIEYLNNNACEVTYEIDVMQTWFFDYELQECFVEREHIEVDGLDTTPEPVALGEYVFNNDYVPLMNMQSTVVIVAVVDTEQSAVDGEKYDRIYGGAELYAFPNSTSGDTQAINSFLSNYLEAPDTIIGMYIVPAAILPGASGNKLSYGTSGMTTRLTMDALTMTETLDGYAPKNKKLYTYPYNFLHVDNGSGSELSLRYEYFNARRPMFEITGNITQPVQVTLRPMQYKDIGGTSGENRTLNTETLSLTGYPMCSWNTDTYKAWVAQNSVPLLINTVSSAIQSDMNTSTGGTGAGLVGNVANLLSSAYKASIAADISKGNLNNGNGNTSTGHQQFYTGRCSIDAIHARMIDNFFSVYGYATNRVKKPNIGKRPRWNYVKTSGCLATGSVPADDMRSICNIYDKGITFWRNASEIGNYSLDNAPV